MAAVQNARRVPPLQKLVRRIVLRIAPETKEIANIKRAFERIDSSHEGKLSMEDVNAALSEAGYKVEEDDLTIVFKCDSRTFSHLGVSYSYLFPDPNRSNSIAAL